MESTTPCNIPAPQLQEIGYLQDRVPLKFRRRPAKRPTYFGEVRRRQGEVVEHTAAEIVDLDRREMKICTSAEVKVGEVLQVVAQLGGRDVRILTQVVQLRIAPRGQGVRIRAHILAVARDGRAQLAAHIGFQRQAESESVHRTRQALIGRNEYVS